MLVLPLCEHPLIGVALRCDRGNSGHDIGGRTRWYGRGTQRLDKAQPTLDVILSQEPVEDEVGDLRAGRFGQLPKRRVVHADVDP